MPASMRTEGRPDGTRPDPAEVADKVADESLLALIEREAANMWFSTGRIDIGSEDHFELDEFYKAEVRSCRQLLEHYESLTEADWRREAQQDYDHQLKRHQQQAAEPTPEVPQVLQDRYNQVQELKVPDELQEFKQRLLKLLSQAKPTKSVVVKPDQPDWQQTRDKAIEDAKQQVERAEEELERRTGEVERDNAKLDALRALLKRLREADGA